MVAAAGVKALSRSSLAHKRGISVLVGYLPEVTNVSSSGNLSAGALSSK
jgi:hypothetical protein